MHFPDLAFTISSWGPGMVSSYWGLRSLDYKLDITKQAHFNGSPETFNSKF